MVLSNLLNNFGFFFFAEGKKAGGGTIRETKLRVAFCVNPFLSFYLFLGASPPAAAQMFL